MCLKLGLRPPCDLKKQVKKQHRITKDR
jgi:hypothetical protein